MKNEKKFHLHFDHDGLFSFFIKNSINSISKKTLVSSYLFTDI